MFIKRLKPNVYDVFVGNGWIQWARVAREKDGEIRQIAGTRLDQRAINYVKGKITR
jgi:hypothetical protein